MTLKYGKPGFVSSHKVNLTLSQLVKIRIRPSNLDSETLHIMEELDAIRTDAERNYLAQQQKAGGVS